MSRTKLITYSILILSGYFFSCSEPFHPKIDDDISILVVDGKITNAIGPYEIRLFRTIDFDRPDNAKPEVGAIISISDDKGNTDSFIEISPGRYQNRTTDFRGIVGRSYLIEIQTSDGKKYESIPEVLPPEILIENIYGEESKVMKDNGEYLKGMGFYLDTKSPSDKGNYMRWEYKESWEWHAPHFIPKTNNPAQICYPYNIPTKISVFDGSKQNKKEFKHLSTSFINENEVKLNYNYFLNVSLYSISFRNYQFWKTIQKSIQDNGGIYDVIPSNAKGNIYPCEDGDLVIGYFEASAVSTKNQTFTIDNFEMEFSDYPEECEEIVFRLDSGSPDEKQFHIIRDYRDGDVHVYIVKHNYCFDCNVIYSPTKPSFWP